MAQFSLPQFLGGLAQSLTGEMQGQARAQQYNDQQAALQAQQDQAAQQHAMRSASLYGQEYPEAAGPALQATLVGGLPALQAFSGGYHGPTAMEYGQREAAARPLEQSAHLYVRPEMMLAAAQRIRSGKSTLDQETAPTWQYKPQDGSTPPPTIGGFPTSVGGLSDRAGGLVETQRENAALTRAEAQARDRAALEDQRQQGRIDLETVRSTAKQYKSKGDYVGAGAKAYLQSGGNAGLFPQFKRQLAEEYDTQILGQPPTTGGNTDTEQPNYFPQGTTAGAGIEEKKARVLALNEGVNRSRFNRAMQIVDRMSPTDRANQSLVRMALDNAHLEDVELPALTAAASNELDKMLLGAKSWVGMSKESSKPFVQRLVSLVSVVDPNRVVDIPAQFVKDLDPKEQAQLALIRKRVNLIGDQQKEVQARTALVNGRLQTLHSNPQVKLSPKQRVEIQQYQSTIKSQSKAFADARKAADAALDKMNKPPLPGLGPLKPEEKAALQAQHDRYETQAQAALAIVKDQQEKLHGLLDTVPQPAPTAGGGPGVGGKPRTIRVPGVPVPFTGTYSELVAALKGHPAYRAVAEQKAKALWALGK